jgi:hypothetical protein
VARSDQLRAAIAQEAARLMAEHGIQDFGLAKRKAAERYRVSEGTALPRNVEIEEALRERQRLFGQGEHEANLRRLRGVALKAMKVLEAFEPRLVGPVLTGTATAHSDVQLHVFADSVEAVVIHLMDRHVEHELVQRRLRLQADREAVGVPGVRFDVGAEAVEALVFPKDGIRQAPVSPVDGRPMRRAGAEDVLAFIDLASGGGGSP